jgi:hypothetical protein
MPKVETYNPTPPYLQQGQQWFATFLQTLLSNPQVLMSMGGPSTNYSANALGQVNPALLAFLNGRPEQMGNPFQEMQFSNEFKELGNPFPQLGAINQAFSTLQAATPIFDRNLKQANTNLATTAPGRFSSAIAAEGSDVNSRALQDFNLFANEALQQGMQLQQQGQDSVLNFLLGARNLQQGAVSDTRKSQIDARGLQQDAEFTNRGQNITRSQNSADNALNAANILGSISNNAGQFDTANRGANLQALMALLGLGGNVFGPQPMTPIVGQSTGDKIAQYGSLLAALWQSGILQDAYGALKGGKKQPATAFTGQPSWYTPPQTGSGTIPNRRYG